VLLGSPQLNDAGYDSHNNPGQFDAGAPNASTITYNPLCSAINAGTVNQSGRTGLSPACPTIPGVDTSTLQYNLAVTTCEFNPALQIPDFTGPTNHAVSGGNCVAGSYCYQSVGATASETWSNNSHASGAVPIPTLKGLYDVHARCITVSGGGSCSDLTIDVSGGPATLNGITLYLEPGAIVSISGANTLTWTPYTSPVDTHNVNDQGFYALYAAPSGPLDSPATTTPSTLNIKGGGNSAQTEVFVSPTGSVVMPGGTINMTSNGWLKLAGGQALAYTWNEQGGNHPSDIITFNNNGAPNEPEVLNLVQ